MKDSHRTARHFFSGWSTPRGQKPNTAFSMERTTADAETRTSGRATTAKALNRPSQGACAGVSRLST